METILSRFDVVAFDWKGTLEAKLGGKQLRHEEGISNVKIELNDEDLAKRFEENFREEEEKARASKLTTTKTKLLETTLDNIGINEPKKRNKLIAAYFEKYNKITKKRVLFEHSHELLSNLVSKSIPIILIRNTTQPKDQFQKSLEGVEADKYFHVDKNVVLSGEVGFEKPDVRIFKTALEKVGKAHVHPHRVLYIGNETEVDIKGAKQLGWKTVLMKSTETTSNGHADFEISSLKEMFNIIFESGN